MTYLKRHKQKKRNNTSELSKKYSASRILKGVLTAVYFMITYLSLSGNETDPLYFHHITANNGLKHNGITSIIQDHKGFMWFASENGLHRFDGTNMKIYMHDSTDSTSLSGNVIYGILEDGRQNLWIASNSGFNKYNRNEGNFIRIGLLPDTNPETKIIYDYYVPATALGKNGEIYVSRGNHGIYMDGFQI
jgi:hypothetical protein